MRDDTFDVMKGIGIIAMIIGHCQVPRIIGNVIFAWHMPLFFIISGYFYKPYPIKEYTKKNLVSLVIPYLITATLMFLLCLLKYCFHEETNIITPLVGILVASGSKGLPMLGEYFVGAIWFLLALFWCRTIYNIIYNKITQSIQGVVIISVAVLSTYIATKLYVPTNFLQGMSAMVFFYVGHIFRKHDLFKVRPNWLIITLGVLIIIASLLSCNNDYSISMVRCYYSYYPINVVAACFCTYLLYHIVLYGKDNHLNKIIAYLGKMSMLILCVHNIDANYSIVKFLNDQYLHMEGIQYRLVSTICHIMLPILIAVVLSRNKVICELFRLNHKKEKKYRDENEWEKRTE